MGPIALAAGVLLGLAMLGLALFFRTGDRRFDQVAEWGFAGFGLTGALTALEVAGRIGDAGGLLAAVGSGLGVAGTILLGLAEVATALRLLDWRRVAPLTTLAFVGVLAWIGLVSVSLASGAAPTIPAGVGWLGIGSIVAGFGVITWLARLPGMLTGQAAPPASAMAAFLVPAAGLVGWFAWLGASF